MGEPLIRVVGLNKRFGANQALNEAEFQLLPGEIHAVVGVNGAGKSTMMKILAGVHQMDSGSFYYCGKETFFASPVEAEQSGIAIVYQELSLIDHLSVAENILIRHLPSRGWVGAIDWKAARATASELLQQFGLNIDPDQVVGELPVGQKQMVEICKALSLDAQVVIFDEPTSALSDRETHILFDAIKNLKVRGVSIIYISHHLDEIFRVADRLTVLRDGKTVATTSVAQTDIGQVVELMLGKANVITRRECRRRGDCPLLEAREITTSYLREPVSLELYPGDIVALAGQLGSGRTELLRALYGLDPLVHGSVLIDGKPTASGHRHRIRAGLGFVPEERKVQGIVSGATVMDNIAVACLDQLSYGIHMLKDKERQRAQSTVDKVGVIPNTITPPIESLSGGNQQKVVLGRWIARSGVRVLLLDEPTRGIDVGAKTQIYRLLDELSSHGVAILFSSSDEEEIVGVADRIIIMRRGALSATVENSGLDTHKLTTKIVGGEV